MTALAPAPRAVTWRVAELFGPTVQGEGVLVGTPVCFVRFGGCDYRCSWCDSLHAVLPQFRRAWTPMSAEGIVAAVLARSAGASIHVVLSGGNPALYDLAPLLTLGQARGLRFSCETQGTRWPAWFAALDLLTLSPKPPSSGETPDLDEFAVRLRGQKAQGVPLEVKVPLFDERDLAWFGGLRAAVRRVSRRLPLFVSVGNPDADQSTAEVPDLAALRSRLLDRYGWLVEAVLARGWFDVRVLPQVHVLAWGNLRGV